MREESSGLEGGHRRDYSGGSGVTASSFPDHFSGHAPDYARYRPDYPDALFDWLARMAPSRRLAWDCATGNGQAATALASRFRRVLATDASALQVRQARPAARVLYAVAAAEAAPLSAESADLVTVAQALHWFDRPRFWAEAARALAPSGVIAVWSYDLLRVSPEVDVVVNRLYRDIVGPYWPAERSLVEQGYAGVEFPFDVVEAPAFTMEKEWSFEELTGYLGTWSAAKRYAEILGEDPLRRVAGDLVEAWGVRVPSEPPIRRRVLWDVHLRVGRKPGPPRPFEPTIGALKP